MFDFVQRCFGQATLFDGAALGRVTKRADQVFAQAPKCGSRPKMRHAPNLHSSVSHSVLETELRCEFWFDVGDTRYEFVALRILQRERFSERLFGELA